MSTTPETPESTPVREFDGIAYDSAGGYEVSFNPNIQIPAPGLLNLADVPETIFKAARDIEHWMAMHGHHGWQFGGVCERNYALKLERELAAATAELAALREDKQLLDWLEDHGHETHICCWHHTRDGKENEWTIHSGDFDDENLIGHAKLLRDTIRAARKATP